MSNSISHIIEKRAAFEELLDSCANEDSPVSLLKTVNCAAPSLNLLSEAYVRQKNDKNNPKLCLKFTEQTCFGAETENGVIRISKQIPFQKKVGFFLFELTNVIQASKYEEIEEQLKARKFSTAADYARAIEKVEYDGIKRCSKVIQQCIAESGWIPEMDPFTEKLSKEWRTFEGFLASQEKSGHFQAYMDQFYY